MQLCSFTVFYCGFANVEKCSEVEFYIFSSEDVERIKVSSGWEWAAA